MCWVVEKLGAGSASTMSGGGGRTSSSSLSGSLDGLDVAACVDHRRRSIDFVLARNACIEQLVPWSPVGFWWRDAASSVACRDPRRHPARGSNASGDWTSDVDAHLDANRLRDDHGSSRTCP